MNDNLSPQTQSVPVVSWQFPYAPERVSGVFAIEFYVAAPPNGDPQQYQLEIGSPNTKATPFNKHLTINPGNTVQRVIVNTHLLDNGPAELEATFKDAAGEVIWNDKIKLNVDNPGPVAAQVRESMLKYDTPLILDGACDSSYYDYTDSSLIPWFDRPDAMETIRRQRAEGKITESEQAALEQFVKDGYLTIPEPIEDSLIDQANAEIDDAVESKWQGYTYGSSQRLEQMHGKYPAIRKIWQHPRVFHYLKLIFGVPAKPCQTLVYVFGSQQDEHQDSIHLKPFPAGYMCGIWIPLEDVQPESGELAIYPGSHRLPRITMKSVDCPKVTNGDWTTFGQTVVPQWRKMIEENHLEKVPYRPKRGTVLIWHENLMHAGSPRIDQSKTRRSVVIHAFAEGAVAFYDSTGMPGVVFPRE